jgi:hypothetical protein
MRGVKAEGGWAVINTERCGIHPNAEMFPEVVLTLWDDSDIPIPARACEEVHEHGALVGDLCKLLLAAATPPLIWRAIGRQRLR